MPTTIYTLSDPRSGEVRYVGKTLRTLGARRAGHVVKARVNRTYVANWIRSLGNHKPTICGVVVVENELGAETERRVIAVFRAQGCRLTNLTDGGEGTLGFQHTSAARDKIRATSTGRFLTDEAKAKISTAHKGRKHTVQSRMNMSAAHVGHVLTATTRGKLSAAGKGNTHGFKPGHRSSPQVLAKVALSLQGNQHAKGCTRSAEHRQSLSRSAMERLRVLTFAQAEEIRLRISSAVHRYGLGRKLATEFGVGEYTISKIVRGQAYMEAI